jgi:hypothetical protein
MGYQFLPRIGLGAGLLLLPGARRCSTVEELKARPLDRTPIGNLEQPTLQLSPPNEFIVRGTARKRSRITVVDWIEPKPVVPGPDDHALIAVLVEAPHGVAPAELPAMTGIVGRCSKLHSVVSPNCRVPATAFEQYARLACTARLHGQL